MLFPRDLLGLVFVNDSYCRTFGISREQALARTLSRRFSRRTAGCHRDAEASNDLLTGIIWRS